MIYLTLLFEFLKIGLFTIGGGYAMIPLVKETVLAHGWIEESVFYEFLGVCESTPGPIAINMATYVGASQGGILGAICATAGVVLPSFVIILVIASVAKKLTQNKTVIRALDGVKPVVVGLIFSAGAVMFVRLVGFDGTAFSFDWKSVVIFAIIFAVFEVVKKVFKKKLSAVSLILISAALGALTLLV